MPSTAQGGERLPDLTPQRAALTRHRIERNRGRRLLRFPNVLLNIGEGPVEVRGRRVNGRMEAVQAIYPRGSGNPRIVPFGAFSFHKTHRHWHLLRVAEYRLLDQEGQEVAGSGKISFCLADTDRLRPELSGSPERKRYARCETNPEAKSMTSGISVGWGDKYSISTPGQVIDITGFPHGDYVLQSRVDPDGLLQELSTENNTAEAPVRL